MDVSKLVERLCASVLRDGFCDHSTDHVLKSLSRPSSRRPWNEQDNSSVIKTLKFKVFDKLLLRKWEWFGQSLNETEMSTECRCLAASHRLGGAGLAKRLQNELERLRECVLSEREALLDFLWSLSVCSSVGDGWTVLDDSGVCLSESYLSLFEGLPRVKDVANIQTALSASQVLFECVPGSGYRGWSSQQPLDDIRTPLQSSLFGGLTLSKVSDLNTRLDFPRLSLKPLVRATHSTARLKHDVGSTFSDCLTGSDVDLCIDDREVRSALLRQWEGWQTKCDYVSEVPAFVDCGDLAFERLTKIASLNKPLRLPRPGDVVHSLIWDMDQVQLLDHTAPELTGTSQALAGLLQVMLIYCRSQLTTLTERCTSDIALLTDAHYLVPLCSFVLKLVNTVNRYPKSLDLVNNLHSLANAEQGNYYYPLLLSMLAYMLGPYFRFVELWGFLGQLDWGVEFGIHGDQEALDRRDEVYWRSGYVMAGCCTPTFLASHAETLLTAGKALNLLKLCNPKHPLCCGNNKPVKLKVYYNASACENVHADCNSYSKTITEQINVNKKQDEEKRKAEVELGREKVEQRREEALKEADRIRRAEEAEVAAVRMKKQSLRHELQEQMETAKAAKLEKAESEKMKDAEMIEKLTSREKLLTQQEQKLAAEVRAELVAHYAELAKEAELRQARAEWKIKRMTLQEKRVQFLQDEERQWSRREDNTVINQQVEQDIDHTPSPPCDFASNPDKSVNPVGDMSVIAESLQTDDMSHDQSHDTSCYPLEHELGVEAEESALPLLLPIERASSPNSEPSSHSRYVLSQQKLVPSPDHHDDCEIGGGTVRPQLTTSLTPGHLPVAGSKGRLMSSESTDFISSEEISLPTNEQGYPQLFTTRGHAPKSTVEQIICGDAEPHPQHFVSSRGHAPPSTIQRLMYPLLEAEDQAQPGAEEGEKRVDIAVPLKSGPSSKFQDDFSKLGAPPLRDILSCMLGPLTQDPATVDNSFLSLYPLDALLETCIALPLLTQSQLVNKALLEHFLVTCDIKKHFVAIKRFLLMEDGEFSHVLSTRLCEQLTFGPSPRYLCSSSFLNPLLCFSLESSLHGRCPEAQRLAFRLKHQPPFIHTHAVDALEFLELKYEVDWPSNIIITSAMIGKYNKVFQLLLQMKRASWALKTTFHHLRQSQQLEERDTRQLQIYRHEFQHFVNIMHEYMSNQLFSISWREFEMELATKVHSLDELIHAHKRFIENAIFRCLLSKKAKPVMNIIHDVLSSILCFSFQSSLVSSSPYKTYKLMCDTHKKFSEGTGLLIKVVSKLVTRGYQPHLEDLLLRLNFNNFYGQSRHSPVHH